MLSKSLKQKIRTVFSNPFVIAFFIGIASLHIVKEMSLARRAAPPPLVIVGPWSLTDHLGQKFGTQELQGKVVIANFFFSRCPSICPKLISDMKEVRKRFEDSKQEVQFLSFSVDPDFDVPFVLQEYRKKNEIEFDNWTFLTGTTEELVDVVMGKMKLHVGEKRAIDSENAAEELFDISHIGEIMLFDQNGDLRGRFSTDTVGLASVVRSAKFLLEKGA